MTLAGCRRLCRFKEPIVNQVQSTDFVPLEQVAEVAGVTPRTVRTWVAEAQLPTYALGDRRRRFLLREDAERLLAPRPVNRHAEPARV